MIHRLGLALSLLTALLSCSDEEGRQGPDLSPPTFPLRLSRLDIALILPGSAARLEGSGFVEDADYEVWLDGQLEATPARLRLDARFINHSQLEVQAPVGALTGWPEGHFNGQISVKMTLGEARGEAALSVQFELRQQLTPQIEALPRAVYPASPVEIFGADFIQGGEGETYFELEATHIDEETGVSTILTVPRAVGYKPQGAWARDQILFDFDPSWVGIRPGRITGQIRVVNEGEGWWARGEWLALDWSLMPPIVEYIQPAASRGQATMIEGQGFIGGPHAGLTLLRFSGDFHAVTGTRSVTAEITPDWISGRALVFSMRVHYDYECRSDDLGAIPGVLIGEVKPIISWEGQSVEGPATPIQFEILPTLQVVWLRFLPAFIDSLRLFGLRSYSGEVQARIIDVIERDYEQVNLEVRLTQPMDFKDYSVVEVGGPDPNAQNLFGLDNTPGLDNCNERLDDNLAGQNADSNGAFGGVFVESFLQLSPSYGDTDNPLAHPAFDDIFAGLIEEPATPDDFPGGPRAEEVREAIRVLGNLIGNTITHELGHSLGLSRLGGCGRYHNADGPYQIMDCGSDRPFEERAELEPGRYQEWHGENLTYLKAILPKP